MQLTTCVMEMDDGPLDSYPLSPDGLSPQITPEYVRLLKEALARSHAEMKLAEEQNARLQQDLGKQRQ